MEEVAMGRREIMQFLKIADWGTVRRWKKAGLPVRYLPNGKPIVIISEVILWMTKYDEMRKKK